MRLNVYAEELGPDPRVEIITKEIEGQKFTGLRFYLELPVTVKVCRFCEMIDTPGATSNFCPGGASSDDKHDFQPRNISGPFIHHPGDDDSSAVTFWGKRDLREVLDKAMAKLDEHYEPRKVTKIVELELPEEDRQMVLLALAVLSLESPGFDHALNEIAKRIDNAKADGRAEMFDVFRELRQRQKWPERPPF